MQFIPHYDIIIRDGYGYSISYRSVGSKGVCPWGKHLGYALCRGLSCAAGVCSNRGRVVNIVAVLRRCLFSKADFRVTWLSYGVIAVIWRGREHRGGVAVLWRYCCNVAWSRAPWRFYGFFGKRRRSRNNRGVVLGFWLNHSEIVVIVAVLRRCL